MVFFFAPRGCDAPLDNFKIYMGLDKFENEVCTFPPLLPIRTAKCCLCTEHDEKSGNNGAQDLIKYGLPHDVWFHVDNLSSAHVYLRLPEGTTVDDIPVETLEDCAQLVKANSIQGSKQTSVDIVYTMWSNLRKTASMEVGQVRAPPSRRLSPAICMPATEAMLEIAYLHALELSNCTQPTHPRSKHCCMAAYMSRWLCKRWVFGIRRL